MDNQQSSSNSIRRGQVALLCQFCEIESRIKWKCLDCDKMMCQRCREKIHPKFPSANCHTIVDIKDVSKHSVELNCHVHSEQICCKFCISCDKLVCPSCVSSKTHKKHKLIEISEGREMKMKQIRNRQEQIANNIQTIKEGEEELKRIKSLKIASYDKVEKEILNHDKAIVTAVKTHTDKLLCELYQKREDFCMSVDEEDKKATETLKKLEEQRGKVENVFQLSGNPNLFSDSDDLQKLMNIHTESVKTDFNHQIPTFVPGDLSQISSLLGKLENTSNTGNTIQVIKMFTSGVNHINRIQVSQKGSLWISDRSLKLVHKINCVNDTQWLWDTLHEQLTVEDMTINSAGNLMVSISNSSNLKLICHSSMLVSNSLYNVTQMQTAAVHAINHNNKILVGAVNFGPLYPATGHRQIVLMDHKGRPEMFFQFDQNRRPLFTHPGRVTTNTQNTIAVIDWLGADGQGRVVILNQIGQLVNVYTGHQYKNDEGKFKPSDIFASLSDNFVIAEPHTHMLHILNSSGQFMFHLSTASNEMNIKFPWSLSNSHNGELYIGCWGQNSPAKIYVINHLFYKLTKSVRPID